MSRGLIYYGIIHAQIFKGRSKTPVYLSVKTCFMGLNESEALGRLKNDPSKLIKHLKKEGKYRDLEVNSIEILKIISKTNYEI